VRYKVPFTGFFIIDAPNVAQAAKQAKKYRVIGRALVASRGLHDRDATVCERGDVTLKIGVPTRLPQEGR